MKTPLDIYLQRHSPPSPDLWLHYSGDNAKNTTRPRVSLDRDAEESQKSPSVAASAAVASSAPAPPTESKPPARIQKAQRSACSPGGVIFASTGLQHQAVVYAANEIIGRVQRQEVVAKFQCRDVYTSRDGRDAQFVPT